MDSERISNDVELTDDCINYESLSNDQSCLLLFSDNSITDSSVKDSWWLEAMRVADDVENKQNMVEPQKHDLIHLCIFFLLRLFYMVHLSAVSKISYKSLPFKSPYLFLIPHLDLYRILAAFYGRS